MNPPDLDTWFEHVDGFSRPIWENMIAWVETWPHPIDAVRAWAEVVQYWLARLNEDLGSRYSVRESDRFILLAALKENEHEAALEFLESTLRQVLTATDGVGVDNPYMKHVVLLFSSPDRYYDYVCYYDQDEGEFGASAGCFLSSNCYPHFVLYADRISVCKGTLVHELIHDCLQNLPLPLWLNEGVTQALEHELCGDAGFELHHEGILEHRNFWDEAAIQEFWVGSAFHRPDAGQHLSYELAKILIRQILVDRRTSRRAFWDFVEQADWKDAGDEAAREHLNVGVAELVEGFLGEGDWQPDPERWPEPPQDAAEDDD